MKAASVSARKHYLDGQVVQRLLKGADFMVLGLGALMIASYSAAGAASDATAAAPLLVALFTAFSAMLAIRAAGLYRLGAFNSPARTAAMSYCAALVASAGALAMAGLAMPMNPSWLVFWCALLAIHVPLTRFATSAMIGPLARDGRFRRRIAIVGGGRAAEEAISLLDQSADIDIEIVGIFDDRYDERSPESIRLHRKIGKIEELADYARNERVDLIIAAIPLSAEARLLHILKRLWELPVDIRISGQASALKLSPRAYTNLGKLPLLSVFDRPLSPWGAFLKSAMDKAIAGLAVVALAPVMGAVAIAVKLESKGPALFKQRRYGFNNELIEVFKFRSMYTDMGDPTASKLVTKDDPRVTRVGRFIRKSSLDELPQLFNVLTGQLSLVGPRPHATQAKAAEALYDQVVDGYFARHKVKPGITGWAQINGWRGETDTREKIEQRVKHDLEYIDRWSLLFDLYIMAKTPFALLKTENAY
jgi:Undecaprenyl-phosphate glucose phosphotransferase